MSKNRLFGLDYLRGFAAFVILIYHYISWGHSKIGVDTFLGRFGIYGVSLFYVLSGLTLYHVYFAKFNPLDKGQLRSFFMKRLFRIYPLLCLVILLTLVGKSGQFDLYTIIINFLGIYGYIDWDNYIAIGSWSIGNELVFYSFLPFFIYFFKSKNNVLKYVSSILIVGLYIYFASFLLVRSETLTDQWSNYVNPLNQLFLFFSGFAIGYIFQNLNLKKSWNLLLFFSGIGIFVFFPSSDKAIEIVTGLERYIFTISCIVICISMYKLDAFNEESILHKVLSFFGEISYSIYLLHPIVYALVGIMISYLKIEIVGLPYYKTIFSIIGSILVSYVVYEYYEKYFIKLGNRIIYKNK